MHRYYQPITPASNKLLKQRWDETYFEEHRRKVATSKAVVDNKPPRTYMHLHLKLKKLQVDSPVRFTPKYLGEILPEIEEERLATIERDNRILLEKMSQIMRTKGRVDNWNDYSAKSLNRTKRQQELLRVTHENQSILKRVLAQKPVYDHSKWEDDWLEKEGYMESISKYPKEWYKKSSGKRKAPVENTRRSEGRSEQDGGGSKRGSKKDRMSPKEERDRKSPINGEERQRRSPKLRDEEENGGDSKRGSKKGRMSPEQEKDRKSPINGQERQARSPSLGGESKRSSKTDGMSQKADKDEKSPGPKEEKEVIVEVDEKVKEVVEEEVKDEVAEEKKEEIKEVEEELKGEKIEEEKGEVVVEHEIANEKPDEKPETEETREDESKDKIENDVS